MSRRLKLQVCSIIKQVAFAALCIVALLSVLPIVIADPAMPLDLTLDLDDIYVENTLDREDWREPEEEEHQWRQQPLDLTPDERWQSESIYKNDRQLEPITPDLNRPSGILDSREAAPQFKRRF